MHFFSIFVASAFGLLVASVSHAASDVEVTQGTILRNVTVVNTRDGSLSPGMAIVIQDGKIQRIAENAAVRSSAAVRQIDGAGKYAIPGLLDMHTHAVPAADSPAPYWPLLLANGITGIREMAGSAALLQRAQQLNADSAAGRLNAPEILLMPGDLVVGVPTAERGAQVVQQQKAMGAAFIKVIAASRDGALGILAEAHKQGLGVAGHLPPALSAEDASNAGWLSIEHLGSGMGVALDCAQDAAAIRGSILRGEGAPPVFSLNFVRSPMLFRTLDAPFYQRVIDGYNAGQCQALAKTFAKNGTWQVPTMLRLKTMEFSDDAQFRNDPNLKYIDPATRAQWEQLAVQYVANVPPTAAATFRAFYTLQKKVLLDMRDNGVRMLAGSDLGGIWVIPGFSLHQEFRELAAIGFTPLQVLQMATLNGAEFLHREDSMGTVEAGKNADLVLLDGNPIADVRNLDRIAAVVLKGRYFSKAELDALAQPSPP